MTPETDHNDPFAPKPDTLSLSVRRLIALDWRRLFVTAVCLCVFLFGHFIPLPGLYPARVADYFSSSGSAALFSIMALGPGPWIVSAVLVELAGSVVPPLRRTRLFADEHVAPFNGVVIAIALPIAGLQAYGITVSMDATGLLEQRGAFLGLPVMASLVGGTVVNVVLARFVEQWGTGHGFWLLFGFSWLTALPSNMFFFSETIRTGSAPLVESIAFNIVAMSILIVLTVFVALAGRQMSIRSPGPVLWPLLLASTVSGFLISLIWIALSDTTIGITAGGEPMARAQAGLAALLMVPLLWFGLARHGACALFGPATVLLVVCIALPWITIPVMDGRSVAQFVLGAPSQAVAMIAVLSLFASGVYGRR